MASGIGSFLFYHRHGDPAGLGPTIRDAEGVFAAGAGSADVLSPADDLAARLAVGMDCMFADAAPFTPPGMGVARGREDALRMLFNPAAPGLLVNGVVIARVGAHGLSPRGVTDFENEWRALVESHREQVDRLQGRTGTSGEEREPPLIYN